MKTIRFTGITSARQASVGAWTVRARCQALLLWMVVLTSLAQPVTASSQEQAKTHALAREAERLRSERGERDRSTLEAYRRLGEAQFAAGDMAALQTLEHLAAASAQALGEGDSLALASLELLTRQYFRSDRLEDYRLSTLRLLKLRTAALGPKHPDTLVAATDHAHALLVGGDPTEALQRLRAVRKQQASDDLMAARTMHAEGLALVGLGRYDEALKVLQRAVDVRMALIGERHADTLVSMGALGDAMLKLGRRVEGLAIHERVAELRQSVLGPEHPLTLLSRQSVADIYRRLGRLAEAYAQGEWVLAARSRTLGPDHVYTIQSALTQAALLQRMGRPADAIAVVQPMLERLRSRGVAYAQEHIHALSTLGQCYRLLGRSADHLAAFDEAVEVSRRAFGESHPRTLALMTEAVWMRSQSQTHRPSRERAAVEMRGLFEASSRQSGPQHPSTLTAQAYLARLLAMTGKLPQALELGPSYVDAIEAMRSQQGIAEGSRQLLFSGPASQYRFLSILSGIQKSNAAGWRLSELSKARTMTETLTVRHAARSANLSEADSSALAELDDRAAALAEQAAKAASDAAVQQQLNATLNQVVRERDALHQRLATSNPKYAQLTRASVSTSAAIAAALPPSAVAVAFVVEGEEAAAFTVPAGGDIKFIRLGRLPGLAHAIEILRLSSALGGGLNQAAQENQRRAWRMPDRSYRWLRADQDAPPAATALSDADEVSAWLGQALLQPLISAFPDARQWVVAPDGALARLPFDLLKVGGRQLGDLHDVTIVPSLSLYAMLRERQQDYAKQSRPRALLAFGNPDFRPEASSAVWPLLPGSEAEVNAVANLFKGASEVLLGVDASEARLKQLQREQRLKDFRYLLFSTHASLSSTDPMLSSIVLSQRGLAHGEDGHITAAEWTSYDLRSDLVVLSACETALGRVIPGEGVLGLPYAMMVAGTVNTVMTLWPVDDDATAVFMRAFFSRLRDGSPISSALAATKRELKADGRFRHPRYWAPFVLVGAG